MFKHLRNVSNAKDNLNFGLLAGLYVGKWIYN